MVWFSIYNRNSKWNSSLRLWSGGSVDAHLRSMQQHGVACPLDGRQCGGGGLGGHHDLTVGVQQRQSHKGQVAAVKHTVLVVDGAVPEQQ